MSRKQLFDEVIRETSQLVKQAATRRGTLALSPEVVDLLQRDTPKPEEAPCNASAALREPAHAASAAPIVTPGPSGARSESESALGALAEIVSVCRNCHLCETRTQTVFGAGNPNARLVFVGEAPGFHEDQQGQPFVGRAGELLTNIIEKGMGVRRSDVYICNVLKCRPPENRDPRPDEVAQCEPFLIQQLEILRPAVICALGGHAAKTLLKTEESIGRLRGKWHFYHGIPLRATYHPAYLLRNPEDKRKTWMDVLEVMKVYRGEVTPEPPSGAATLL